MIHRRTRKVALGALVALCALYALYELAFWTLPRFEQARNRRRLPRIAGARIIYHDDGCNVYLTRPVQPKDVDALGAGLSSLPKISRLYITMQCRMPPDGYAALTRASSIYHLRIDEQALEADQTKSIARIPGLARLELRRTRFPGGSLAPLKDAYELRSLEIFCVWGEPCGTIDENDMHALAGLSSLKELSLIGTGIRESWVEDFRSRRPDVEVHWPRPLIEESLLDKLRSKDDVQIHGSRP